MRKTLFTLAAVFWGTILAGQARAGYLEGGDAASKDTASVILDIAFAIDTSASMSDDQIAITNAMSQVVSTLACPDCDVWIQASFYGIAGTGSGLFNTNLNGTVVNSNEDNAGAVVDLINDASIAAGWMKGGATAGQDYYRAIVTIGDEGTENGHPVDEADWAAARQANQTAIANNVLLFSITGSPYYTSSQDSMWEVFKAMAVGGTKTFGSNTYTLGDTGGTFDKFDQSTIVEDLQRIICTAGSGPGEVPEPGTMLLLGTGLAGLAAFRRKRSK